MLGFNYYFDSVFHISNLCLSGHWTLLPAKNLLRVFYDFILMFKDFDNLDFRLLLSDLSCITVLLKAMKVMFI